MPMTDPDPDPALSRTLGTLYPAPPVSRPPQASASPIAQRVQPMTRPFAYMMLVFAAFLWGSGNVANKTVLAHVDPILAVGLRCAVASALVLPLIRYDRHLRKEEDWLRSAIGISILFAAGILTQQAAFGLTSVTNASFLISATAVFTPVLGWVLLGDRPTRRILIAGPFVIIGVYLMGNAGLSVLTVNRGDSLCLLSAVIYAAWTVCLGRHACRYGRPFATCSLQFALTAILMLCMAPLYAPISWPEIRAATPEILYLGAFSTAAAFVLLTIAQAHLKSSTVAILVSAESVFGAIAANLLLQERLSLGIGSGAALILFAIIIVVSEDGDRPSLR